MYELYHGDCLKIMKDIPDGSIDMVLCDLPYGITQCEWDSMIQLDVLWAQYERITKPTTPIALFGIEPFSSKLRLSKIDWYKYDWIWDKVKGTGFLNAKKQPMRCHEIVSMFYRKQCLYNPIKTTGHAKKVSHRSQHLQTDVYGYMRNDYTYNSTERYPRSIQVFSTDTQNSSLHPTQKPVALCEYLIKTYTNPGDTILDNCMGSGTTGVAAINTGRNFIGIELNEKYFGIAKERIENTSKESA